MSNRLMLLLSIVERGKGKKLMTAMTEKNIHLHHQSVGYGTAPSEMMDIFGLGTRDKDIIYSFAPETTVNALASELGRNLGGTTKYGGLLIALRLTAVNRLVAGVLTHGMTDGEEKGETMEHKYNLVMITVNQGYSEQVMQAARKAGATGGTVIRGRMAEAEHLKELAQVDVQEEREIIFILASTDISAHIMNDVNKEFGLRTEAQGILCALPIDKAIRI